MYRIGIDIGGTQLRAALLDDEMNIIDSFKTVNDRKLSGAENMDRIIRYIKSVNEPLQGIGIGSPGPLDLKRGVVVNPPNLIGWDNFEIVKYMEENTGLKTWLDNDANVAGLAEALRGADLILVPTANTSKEPSELFQWEIKIQAFQNSVFIAMCNRVGQEGDMHFSGESILCGPDGATLALAGGEEELLLCEVDLPSASRQRTAKPYTQLRRPECYE